MPKLKPPTASDNPKIQRKPQKNEKKKPQITQKTKITSMFKPEVKTTFGNEDNPRKIDNEDSTKRRNSASESSPVKLHCASKPVQKHESMMFNNYTDFDFVLQDNPDLGDKINRKKFHYNLGENSNPNILPGPDT